jgi:hypothetical protein
MRSNWREEILINDESRSCLYNNTANVIVWQIETLCLHPL